MNTIKKYIVHVGYRGFEFDSGTSALSFATVAAKALVHDDAINNEVTITVVVEAVQEGGPEDEENV